MTAVEILDQNAADSAQFKPLADATAQAFKVEEVMADKAYTSAANYEAVAAHGRTLYAPFKSNMAGAASVLFEKMYYRFMLDREGF